MAWFQPKEDNLKTLCVAQVTCLRVHCSAAFCLGVGSPRLLQPPPPPAPCHSQYVWGMDQISKKHQTLTVGFSSKLTSKGTWRQVFIYLSPPPLQGFLFGVVNQFCKFGIWSNTQIITPVDALHITQSPPPPVTHCIMYILRNFVCE